MDVHLVSFVELTYWNCMTDSASVAFFFPLFLPIVNWLIKNVVLHISCITVQLKINHCCI